MKLDFIVHSIDDLPEITSRILEATPESRLWAFYGDMGLGKTTLIHQFMRNLGVEGAMGSPTYAIVNTHSDRDENPVYHFDFYRFKTIEEAYDIGYETYWFSGNHCFMEWPERVEDLLPDDTVRIKLSAFGNSRKIEVNIPR